MEISKMSDPSLGILGLNAVATLKQVKLDSRLLSRRAKWDGP